MMYEKSDTKKYDKYDAPYLEGYWHIGNSAKETEQEAIQDYVNAFNHDIEKLVARPFIPDNRTPDDPLWQYITKWAIYKKVE